MQEIKDLAQEERQKMEVWAEATRLTASKNTAVDLSLVLKILEGNTTIPVVLCNDKDSIMFVKNISFPENDVEEFKKVKVKELKSKNTIVIDMEDGTFQYVYYDDSVILKRLLIYPYAQLTVVFVFIVIAFLALASTKKAEQNKVWVGLSKETAHQLGTPISSLIAWVEYLRTKDIDSSLLNEMEKDVKRLETIAERFSKIGANLQQKRRFADAGRTAHQHQRALHGPAAQDPVQLPHAGGKPDLLVSGEIRHGAGPAAGHAHPDRGPLPCSLGALRLLHNGIPCTTGGTASRPLGRLIAALRAEKNCLRFHGYPLILCQ